MWVLRMTTRVRKFWDPETFWEGGHHCFEIWRRVGLGVFPMEGVKLI